MKWFRLVAIAFSIACVNVFAAFDAFLKIDGVPGESRDAKHPGEIEVLSFTQGIVGSTDPFGGTGRAQLDFAITKLLDKATPTLFLSCANGKHYPTAVLTLRNVSTGQEYFKITLTDIIISGVQSGGSTTDARPIEQVSMNFAKIQWEYFPVDDAGRPLPAVRTGWDLAANKPF